MRSLHRLWLSAASLLVAAAAARGAPIPLVECRVPDDPDRRVFRVVDRGGDLTPRWVLTLAGRQLGSRVVELPLHDATVERSANGLSIASRSANGGLAVTVRATGDESGLDVFVNFELEVNVWRDLSPDVEQMNTDGPLAHVRCRTLSPPEAMP